MYDPADAVAYLAVHVCDRLRAADALIDEEDEAKAAPPRRSRSSASA